MTSLSPPDYDINPIDRSADLTVAHEHKSLSFAAEAARAAFGRRYPAEGFDQFQDKSPAEVAALRATRWPGAAR